MVEIISPPYSHN